MKITPLAVSEVLLIEPKVFGDDRGFFYESFHAERYREAGVVGRFVQDNFSRSAKGILRGLHLQHPDGQGKLVSVIDGEVFDVAVDVRVGSPTFGRYVSGTLTGPNKRQMWIPPGFAHGFCVTSEAAIFHYKCTNLYSPESELGVAWDDPDLGIEWPIANPVLSAKDQKNPRLKDIPKDRLPVYEG